jgi:hypothetical protein
MNFQPIKGVFKSPIEGGAEPVKEQPEVLELEIEEGRKVKINLSPEVKNWLREKGIVTEDDIKEFFRDLLTNFDIKSDLIKEFLNSFELLIRYGEVLFLEKKGKLKEVNIVGRVIMTRRAFIGLVISATLGLLLHLLGIRRYLEEAQISTPTPTTLPSTETPTPTSAPTPTQTPTKTPSLTPTAPTIEEEKVREIKERFVKILEFHYPSIYRALFKDPPPFVIKDPSDFLPYLLFITWQDTFGNSANIRDLSFYLKPNRENPNTVKIRMSKEIFKKLFWRLPQKGMLIRLETQDGPVVGFYYVLNEKLLSKLMAAPQIMVIIRSKKPGEYKITEIDDEIIMEIEVASGINLDPKMSEIVGRKDLGEFRGFIGFSTVSPPDLTEYPPQNIALIDENAEIFTFQRLGLSLLLAKIVFYSLKGTKRNYLVKLLSEDLLESLEEGAKTGKEYLLPTVYKIFTDPNYKEALRRLIYELVEKWQKEVQD